MWTMLEFDDPGLECIYSILETCQMILTKINRLWYATLSMVGLTIRYIVICHDQDIFLLSLKCF